MATNDIDALQLKTDAEVALAKKLDEQAATEAAEKAIMAWRTVAAPEPLPTGDGDDGGQPI